MTAIAQTKPRASQEIEADIVKLRALIETEQTTLQELETSETADYQAILRDGADASVVQTIAETRARISMMGRAIEAAQAEKVKAERYELILARAASVKHLKEGFVECEALARELEHLFDNLAAKLNALNDKHVALFKHILKSEQTLGVKLAGIHLMEARGKLGGNEQLGMLVMLALFKRGRILVPPHVPNGWQRRIDEALRQTYDSVLLEFDVSMGLGDGS